MVEETVNSASGSALVKSIVMGWAISRKRLSITNVRPSSRRILSPSPGSSRAIARAGVPHPPLQGMILMAETSFSRLANSFSLILAFSVISIIFSPLRSKAPNSH
jgi:hypothetical protein